jgi:hypothetical protein
LRHNVPGPQTLNHQFLVIATARIVLLEAWLERQWTTILSKPSVFLSKVLTHCFVKGDLFCVSSFDFDTIVATSVVKMSDSLKSPPHLDTASGSASKEEEDCTLDFSKTHDVKAPTVGRSVPTEPLQPDTPFPEGGLQAWLVVFGAWAGL